MNRKYGIQGQALLVLILGIAALMLRKMLYTVAVDARGLLLRGHPLTLALTVLTAAALLVAVLASRRGRKPEWPGTGFPENLLAALGHVAAAAGIVLTVLGDAAVVGGYLAGAWRFLGLAAPACLLLAGIARVLGKRPFFLLYVSVCLFFLVHIVTRYQLWSANPQMQDYVFALIGAMALMFFGFYEASQEAGCADPRMKLGMGLAALFLCLAELGRSACPDLYLGGILWVLTELGGMKRSETK